MKEGGLENEVIVDDVESLPAIIESECVGSTGWHVNMPVYSCEPKANWDVLTKTIRIPYGAPISLKLSGPLN
jgi:hypothetical protein